MIKLLDYEFEYIKELQAQKDSYGTIIEYEPQTRYRNHKSLPLGNHGVGSFCKFSIDRKWTGIPGVYMLMSGSEILYIGQTVDFAQRFNTGYGNISPKNCFAGGQVTNCKINKLVLDYTKRGKRIALYFHQSIDFDRIEDRLIEQFSPPYNGSKSSGSAKNLSLREPRIISDLQPVKTAPNQHKNPTIAQVRQHIREELLRAKEAGDQFVQLQSGMIHKRLRMNNAMPTVCAAMRSVANECRFEIVAEPPKGNGSRLIVKYYL